MKNAFQFAPTKISRKYFTLFVPLSVLYIVYFYQTQLILIIFNLRLLLAPPSIQQLVPPKPTYRSDFIHRVPKSLFAWDEKEPLQLKCNTCALVFNSGHLLGSKAGAEIDANQCVVRLNDAPIGGKFQSDVGKRTTVRIVRSVAARNILEKTKRGEFVIGDEIIIFITTAGAKVIQRFPDNNFYMTSKTYFQALFFTEVEKVFQNSSNKSKFRRNADPVASTGFLSISMMTNFCNYITIYGMAPPGYCESHPGSSLPYHYYDADSDQRTECGLFLNRSKAGPASALGGNHLYTTEHEIFNRWRFSRNMSFRVPAWS